MPVANSIHHSNHIYNYFKSLKLGLILSDVYHNHLMTIMVSIFLCGYRGKTIDFAEVSCQHRTTTASHTKPSSQALHPIEAAYFHQSHLKGCQDYGHQVVSVMLSCNGIILNYAVILYDRSKSKIRIVQEIAEELPVAPVISYFLCDSWYTSARDTQCGMFAATKVLQRYGLKYSYIYNCTTKSEEFVKGYETFIRTAAVLKSLRTLRIAKIGERPVPFMSVMTNEANLIKRFGITTVPISPVEICNRARKILEEKGKEYIKYEEEFVRKFPDGENFQQICATKLAVQELMEENNCSVAAFECWSAFPTLMGLCPCVVLGEMADNGMPLSCETDINGAITLAILRACNLFEESEFLADLTIRHPQNDNAELLWHCGPFPYSLKKDGVEAKLVDGQERFELKQGDLTVCRFDDIDGEYYLFAGEAKTTTGPKTNGTYVWMETDNWKRWEEKLMFGPYIHHLGCVYGHYLPVLREVSRYLGIHFDNAHEQGIYSL